MTMTGNKPAWITFDCYGTLIQFDEGLLAAVERILSAGDRGHVDPTTFLRVYDKYEHALEQRRPHHSFRSITAESLRAAMAEFGLTYASSDGEILTASIPKMPPFPEAVAALGMLKAQGFRLCIISNTDDDIIAGNVAQLNGHVDKVITAQHAKAYKPCRGIFDYAHRAIDAGIDDIVHVCASPHLDLAAARDMGFRCIWIDRGTGRKPLPDYVPDQVFPTLELVPEFLRSVKWN